MLELVRKPERIEVGAEPVLCGRCLLSKLGGIDAIAYSNG
jgi:hypothetical protein